ncbi:hypothetical protein ATANTOWER_013664 [Ataeniobius toweri]|uniref:Uncharacterized protein n=1 Tax=Ataeniobius toweri TaxID=208326 RepID=A0ABU7BCI5_9TELE|nr:hypothetical protein [Ataeniobius toweri]
MLEQHQIDLEDPEFQSVLDVSSLLRLSTGGDSMRDDREGAVDLIDELMSANVQVLRKTGWSGLIHMQSCFKRKVPCVTIWTTASIWMMVQECVTCLMCRSSITDHE